MAPLGPVRRTPPTLMALGPLGRIIAQSVVAGIAIIARTLPAAYAAALENARKSGTTANDASTDPLKKGASFLGKAQMSKDEAYMVLNLTEEEVSKDVTSIQRQYDRYFAANAVENGGSFYVQSKVYRAKELLDEYAREKNAQESKGNDAPKRE